MLVTHLTESGATLCSNLAAKQKALQPRRRTFPFFFFFFFPVDCCALPAFVPQLMVAQLLEEAIEKYDAAVTLNPRYSLAFYYYGRALKFLARLRKADPEVSPSLNPLCALPRDIYLPSIDLLIFVHLISVARTSYSERVAQFRAACMPAVCAGL